MELPKVDDTDASSLTLGLRSLHRILRRPPPPLIGVPKSGLWARASWSLRYSSSDSKSKTRRVKTLVSMMTMTS